MIWVFSYLFFDKYWHFLKKYLHVLEKCRYFQEMSTFSSKITTSIVWSQFLTISRHFSKKKCRHFQSNVDISKAMSRYLHRLRPTQSRPFTSRASEYCHFRGHSIITPSLGLKPFSSRKTKQNFRPPPPPRNILADQAWANLVLKYPW